MPRWIRSSPATPTPSSSSSPTSCAAPPRPDSTPPTNWPATDPTDPLPPPEGNQSRPGHAAGCHIRVRPVGLFWMRDEKGPDAKVLCVPARDPRWEQVRDIQDLSPHLLDEIAHFFDVYKTLEPGKSSETRGWDSAEVAAVVIDDARRRFGDPSSVATGE